MNRLVTKRTALLAKDAGFNLPTPLKFHTTSCDGQIREQADEFISGGVQDWNSNEFFMQKWKKDCGYLETISRPTQEQLTDWLRKHNIDFVQKPIIGLGMNKKYSCDIFHFEGQLEPRDTVFEALEQGLEYGLKLLSSDSK